MDIAATSDVFAWIGIAFCISQSAMFSGLNLAFFSLSRLRLEVEVNSGNANANKVLRFREDSNFLLTTILWGNVGINVLLTLLSDSVLAGIGAFLFSTGVITIAGEILPQAYFSRNALKMAAGLSPVLRFYQLLLYPIAKPSAKVLDWWLGPESIQYLREHGLRELIRHHIEADEADIDRLEGLGALNFLAIDDLRVVQEGESLDPDSVIALPEENGRPVFPAFERTPDDPFLRDLERSGRKWVIVTGANDQPLVAVDSDGFLRDALFKEEGFNPFAHCHRPIVVTDLRQRLGNVLARLSAHRKAPDDDIVDHDLIVIWGATRRVITGADILGRLLRGTGDSALSLAPGR